jgi:hypothetical protein
MPRASDRQARSSLGRDSVPSSVRHLRDTRPSSSRARSGGPGGSPRRRRSLLWGLALLVPAALWLVPGCGTDAVGIEACRQVETARCDIAPACAGFDGSANLKTEEQVKNCREFYRDHCLLGLENTKADPGQGDIDACVKAIKTTAKCADPKKSEAGACGVALREGVDPTVQPCEVLQNPHWLQACKWLDKNKQIKVGDGSGEGGGGGAGGGTPSLSGADSSAAADASSTADASSSSEAATTGGSEAL